MLIENVDILIPVEIKSGQTLNTDFFKGLKYWDRCNESGTIRSWLVYGGQENNRNGNTVILGWPHLGGLHGVVT